ncbi:hypothetical protein [Salipiger sp. PrR003]|uniref:hypothetical protein n=1 Tax=Salipiger sp. PrR003 TaxID=2706776 RepID=UPI0013DCF90F|nr:hypothetical protein [Salipiger sp. PrR003]NDV53925.1 hypothetical protein [Salipiger sp. PrR003]
MAKLPAIIDLISKHDTRSVATISNYARVLRDHGLLPKGKRGRGAPDIHPLEVADLVLGLAGAFDAVNAPHATRVLRAAKLAHIRRHNGDVEDAMSELRHWTIAESCEDFGFLLASILTDEPRRNDSSPDIPGVMNMHVTIHEVEPGKAYGSAEVYLDNGEHSFFLHFQTHSTEEEFRQLIAELGSDGFASKAWSRSTSINIDFFYDASRCLLGISDADQEPEIDPAPD